MEKTEVIDNEYMSLWYYPALKIVHHKIHKTLPNGMFEEVLSAGAEYMEKYRAKKWLSDDSSLVAISKDDIEFGEKVWSPRVMKAGFRYWAIVMPKNAMGSLQIKRFIKDYSEKSVIIEPCETVEAALEWLSSK